MKDTIITITLSILLATGFTYAIMYAIDKNESNECIKWQQQSEEYSDFYWTDWQLKQCNK